MHGRLPKSTPIVRMIPSSVYKIGSFVLQINMTLIISAKIPAVENSQGVGGVMLQIRNICWCEDSSTAFQIVIFFPDQLYIHAFHNIWVWINMRPILAVKFSHLWTKRLFHLGYPISSNNFFYSFQDTNFICSSIAHICNVYYLFIVFVNSWAECLLLNEIPFTY